MGAARPQCIDSPGRELAQKSHAIFARRDDNPMKRGCWGVPRRGNEGTLRALIALSVLRMNLFRFSPIRKTHASRGGTCGLGWLSREMVAARSVFFRATEGATRNAMAAAPNPTGGQSIDAPAPRTTLTKPVLSV
jgi:hypothetical protein